MANATVTARHALTRRQVEAVSRENGSWVLPNVPSGRYEITITATGFRKFIRPEVSVDPATRTTVDATLEIGDVTESIKVTENVALLQAETAQMGRVVTSRQITDLALNGRNPTNLVLLKAGVVGSNFNAFNPTSLDNSFTINGGRANGNNITIDGVPAQRTRGDSGSSAQIGVFNVDTIQEVQILTSNYPAEYGRAMDGQVRFVTRGGGRDFHGSAWNFLRNSAMDANSWVRNNSTNRDDSRRAAPFRFNQPGYSIGGPVFIPKRFNADRSRYFFFFSQEWIAFRRESTSTGVVPTLSMRNGDFSELLSASNPVFRRAIVVREPSTNSPFPGNVIPPARLSPNGIGILKSFPTPTPGYQQGTNNWIQSRPNPRDVRKDVIRADAYHGVHRFSFSGSNYYYAEDDPFRTGFDRANTRWRRPNMTGAISVTSALSPTLINDASFSAANDKVDMQLFDTDGVPAYQRSRYGIDFRYLIPGPKRIEDRIPTAQINGFSTIDGSSKPGSSSGPIYTWSDNLTWVANGQHTLKFGVLLEHAQQNNADQIAFNQNGWFTFQDTGNPMTTGLAVANAALGNFDTYFEIGPAAYTLMRSNMIEWYAQDTWKAGRKLTIEMGLRHSWFQPWYAKWNDISNFDERYYDPSRAAVVDRTGGYIVSGDPYNGIVLPGSGFPDSALGRALGATLPDVQRLFHGLPRGFADPDGRAFAPRLGVAYRLRDTTVLRGGVGLFYARQMLLNGSLFRNAPNQPRVDVVNGQVDAPGGAGARDFPFGLGAINRNFPNPRAWSYSFSVQQSLPGAIALEAAYVGKSGQRLERIANINQMAPGTTYANPNVNPNALRPYRGLAAINFNTHDGSSSYHSLQLSADRRFHNGLAFGIAYTFSKNLENTATPYNAIQFVRARTASDRPHVLNINYIYELPFFRARKGVVGQIAGGWQLSGVTYFRSGNPLSVTDSADIAGVGPGSAAQPWNLVGDTSISGPMGVNQLWFNTAAFARPANGTFGNAGLNILRGPSFSNWDAAMFKNFRIAEWLSSQFRFEVFNFPNHPLLANPGTNPRAGNFGLITSKSGERNVQLGLKFLF